MFWQDILVSRRADGATIAPAAGGMFDVASSDVVVVDDLVETLHQVTPLTRLLVQRTMTGGDFPMQLSVYILDDQIEQQVADPEMAVAGVQRLSRLLGGDILISDDAMPGDEPWLLLRPDGGRPRQVLMDAEAMNRDEYRIARREASIPV